MADLGREPHLKERSDAQMCVGAHGRGTSSVCLIGYSIIYGVVVYQRSPATPLSSALYLTP